MSFFYFTYRVIIKYNQASQSAVAIPSMVGEGVGFTIFISFQKKKQKILPIHLTALPVNFLI
jgi:hypothetical protein